MARTFERRRRDGRVVVTLAAREAQLLRWVLDDLAAVVSARDDGEIARRLYPRAYLDPTEEEAEQQWQALVHDDLVRERAGAVAAMIADIDGAEAVSRDRVRATLDDEQQSQWVRVLNDARLALGTVLGVSEDAEPSLPADDPRVELLHLYYWVTALQAELVDLLLDALPESGVDDDPDHRGPPPARS